MYFFSVGNGKVSSVERKRISRILSTFDTYVDFVCYNDNGNHRYWFEGLNMGSPYDQRLATRVYNAVGPVKTMTEKREW